ncbi:uncharacterized protein LOC134513912 [Chroicocephalus ridibundus]|uniref:uncharacterized protein LOC134513912 n=1 Tax=Chroicocephalus ridibundus TaxID=1192867 RepID=UPI002FDE5724
MITLKKKKYADSTACDPSHGRQSFINFSNVGPSHRLQFFMNCSRVDPFHRVESFRKRLLQHGSPTGSQILPANVIQHGLLSPWGHRLCWEPAPAGDLHGDTASFKCIYLLRCGVLHRLQVDFCSATNLQDLQGDSLPHHALHHMLQGNLCSGTWSTSPCSFFTDFDVCRVVSLTYSHSSLSSCFSTAVLFLFLKYVIPEVLATSLIGSALASGGSILKLASFGSVRHGGASSSFSQKPPL